MKLDNILELDIIQKMKDQDIKLYSYNKDDYGWQSMFYNRGSYNTYEELNNDKSNDDYNVGYFLKTKVWNKWQHAIISKQEENCAAINAHIQKMFNGKWQTKINIYCSIKTIMAASPILFNTRDEAATAVEKWFKTYIFSSEDNNDELFQNNDLLDQICSILK